MDYTNTDIVNLVSDINYMLSSTSRIRYLKFLYTQNCKHGKFIQYLVNNKPVIETDDFLTKLFLEDIKSIFN